MDEGPFRASRPADNRRVVARPQPVQRQPESPQQVRVEPQAEERQAAPERAKKQKKTSKRFKLPFILLIVLILGIGGWLLWSSTRNTGPAIDATKYQAVFFTNGQVYFGNLKNVNNDYLKLTNIYYLQTQSEDKADSENPQQSTTDQSNVQLIKLGDEIHGPEDAMIISKDQVLFYEDLKPEGKVAQSIEQFKKTK